MWYWNSVDCNEALPGVHNLEGCVEITDNSHAFKTQTIPVNKIWSSDGKGYPVLADVPAPTASDYLSAAQTKKTMLIESANAYINSKQWPGKAAIARLKNDELEQYNLWLDYLDALDIIDISSPPDINWPALPLAG